jgi:hypothetical protein
MPIINKGTAFSNGEQLTADKINNLLDLATFNQSATDSASTTVNSASQIVVADSGITTAKLATDAVETAKIAADAVTTAKILDANVTFSKLTDVIDDDTMATATATTLATSKSIKAYVDTSGIVQSALAEDGTQQTITASIPADNSIPQITEGVQIFSLTMTPKSTSNRMKVLFSANILNLSAIQYTVVALFEGNTCVGASRWTQASNGLAPISLQFYFNPSSTSETVYTMRLGPNSGTCYFNGNGSGPTLGGLNKSKFYIEELSL